jgi:DNA-binding GntR family transcriptional regulator
MRISRSPAAAPGSLDLGTQTISQAVASQIRREIERGTLPPGSRLRQGEIARRYNVSTTPVREAFATLQTEGVINVDAHRGAVVFTPTERDLRQLFQIRLNLEPFALSEAVPRLTEAELDSLQELVDRMRSLDDHVAWLELNDEFHMRLYRAGDNERLFDIIESLRKASRYYIHLYTLNSRRSARADQDHQAILDACRARDAAKAREATQRHLELTMQGVLEYFESSASLEPVTQQPALRPG